MSGSQQGFTVLNLPQALPIDGTEALYVVQKGFNRQASANQLKTFIGAGGGGGPGGPFLPLAGNATVTGPVTFAAATTFGGTLSAGAGGSLAGTFSGSPAFSGKPQFTTDVLPTFSMGMSGAVGNGVTDDVAVIQAWLNGLSTAFGVSGCEIVLPPGKWYDIHSVPLVIPPGFIIRGSYNTKDNRTAGGNFLASGGFYINPALPVGIILRGASSLRNLKIYREGITVPADDATAEANYAIWAAEGVYRKMTTVPSLATDTVIFMSDTSGIAVGMVVTGLATLVPSITGAWIPTTVTAINPNFSVTLSAPIGATTTTRAGRWLRFGFSIGVMIARNCGDVTLDNCCFVGFRTGFQSTVGQFSFSENNGDCITNIEITGGGSVGWVKHCQWLPLYGAQPSTGYVRPGDMAFIHDVVGIQFISSFGIGWQGGWHCENANVQFTDCFNEMPRTAGPATENWLIRGGSSMIFKGCHGQAGSIGFHLDGVNNFELIGCPSQGSQLLPEDNVAHIYVENVFQLLAYPGRVSFTAGGTVSPPVNDTLTQGGVTATITQVVLLSGTWAAGTAAGQLIISTPSGGNFAAGAATTTSGANVTLSGAQVAPISAGVGHMGGSIVGAKTYGGSFATDESDPANPVVDIANKLPILLNTFNNVGFTAGGTKEPQTGETVTQGGVTAILQWVVKQSGSWAAGIAAGQLVVSTPVGGNFSAGVAVTTSGATVTLSGAQIAAGVINDLQLLGGYIQDIANPPVGSWISGSMPFSGSPSFQQGVVYVTKSTGSFTVALAYHTGVIIDGLGTLSTSTIELPPYPIDGQTYDVWFNVAVTMLTLASASQRTSPPPIGSVPVNATYIPQLIGNYNNPAAGTHLRAIYELTTNTWYFG